MGKFVNTVVYIPDDDEPKSQIATDTETLSATVVYMANYYKEIFDGLDNMISTINNTNKENKNV